MGNLPIGSLDASTIKRARRKLIADLELEGEKLHYKGQRLDRSACERACDDLDELDQLCIWHRVANLPALNEFLGSGQTDFLLNPTAAASLLGDAELMRKVGSRYAEQYDKALLAAFRSGQAVRLQQVVAAPALYPTSETHRANRSLHRLLQNILENLQKQTDSFDEDDNEQTVLASFTKRVLANLNQI